MFYWMIWIGIKASQLWNMKSELLWLYWLVWTGNKAQSTRDMCYMIWFVCGSWVGTEIRPVELFDLDRIICDISPVLNPVICLIERYCYEMYILHKCISQDINTGVVIIEGSVCKFHQEKPTGFYRDAYGLIWYRKTYGSYMLHRWSSDLQRWSSDLQRWSSDLTEKGLADG